MDQNENIEKGTRSSAAHAYIFNGFVIACAVLILAVIVQNMGL